ncbi:MAG: ferredoxin [Deferrisomatales bacterium]
MKVFIDRETCIACGVCYEACPEVFEEDPDDSRSRIVPGYRLGGDPAKGEVPQDLEACAREAEEQCPVEAIRCES